MRTLTIAVCLTLLVIAANVSAKGVIVLSLVYFLPGLLVLLGSFLHAVKRWQTGQFLLMV